MRDRLECARELWSEAEEERERVVREVVRRLVETYGLPRHGNPEDPFSDVVYLVLSNRTPPERAQRLYAELSALVPDWDDLPTADPADVERLLRPGGFAHRRTEQLQASAARLIADFGTTRVSEQLGVMPTGELLSYLEELPGVSAKVARCVAAYTLGRDVLAVDVHVHRIACRLGWTTKQRPEQAHGELDALVPIGLRHSFHVTAIAHGRNRCTAKNPRCQDCPVRLQCYFVTPSP